MRVGKPSVLEEIDEASTYESKPNNILALMSAVLDERFIQINMH